LSAEGILNVQNLCALCGPNACAPGLHGDLERRQVLFDVGSAILRGAPMFNLPPGTAWLLLGFPVFWIVYTIVFLYASRHWGTRRPS
jgi:hypothetical protein